MEQDNLFYIVAINQGGTSTICHPGQDCLLTGTNRAVWAENSFQLNETVRLGP